MSPSGNLKRTPHMLRVKTPELPAECTWMGAVYVLVDGDRAGEQEKQMSADIMILEAVEPLEEEFAWRKYISGVNL